MQLLNGKTSEEYPADMPHGFNQFHETRGLVGDEEAFETLLKFLHTCGITLSSDALKRYTQSGVANKGLLFRKALLVFKGLAYASNLDVAKPFAHLYRDVDFFLKIETGEVQLSIFDEQLPELYGRAFALPAGYEDDPTILDFFNQIESSNKSFLITGKAGSGKSTFIRYFHAKTKKTVVRMAFTGIAAINVNGVTIHSFFQFPLRPLFPNDDGITIFKDNSYRRESIRSIDTIIIDEISMLRADILEAIDFSLRRNGGDPDQPFGGKQILLVGDPFQLPPVTNEGDEFQQYLFKEAFSGSCFFNSHAYQALKVRTLLLKTSFRQNNDTNFVVLLDDIRTCRATKETLAALNRRVIENYVPKPDEFSITLTTSNAIARRENERRLAQLTGRKFRYDARVIGDLNPDQMPASEFLELKRGAQVIFIRNDASRRWVNGTIGVVEFIEEERLDVRLADGTTHTVERETWDNRGYKFDRTKRKIVSELKGRLEQYPIRLAWAITIHKSQGLTFDKVIIDLGHGAFAPGQLYTALSRCRSLDGIVLRRPVAERDLIRDEQLLDFYAGIERIDGE